MITEEGEEQSKRAEDAPDAAMWIWKRQNKSHYLI